MSTSICAGQINYRKMSRTEKQKGVRNRLFEFQMLVWKQYLQNFADAYGQEVIINTVGPVPLVGNQGDMGHA